MTEPKIIGDIALFENFDGKEIDISNDGLEVDPQKFRKYNGKKLVIKNCPNLEEIKADCLNLTGLVIEDIDDCPKLKYLSAYNNNFTELDLANLEKLTEVNVAFNNLKTLDVEGCSNLKILSVNSNELESLDLEDNELLESLNCSKNPIESLVITHLENLRSLWCNNCYLSELDCSGLENLEEIFCFSNLGEFESPGVVGVARSWLFSPLSQIKLDGCLSLKALDCAENSIEELFLGEHPNLQTVSCRNNRLEKIFIDDCPNLSYLDYDFQQIFTWKNWERIIDNIETCIIFSTNSVSNIESLFIPKDNEILIIKGKKTFPATFDDFPKLKVFCAGGEQENPGFEAWFDKKNEAEQKNKHFNQPDEDYESETSSPDASNFKEPPNKNEEFKLSLSHMRMRGKLVIKDWPKLVQLNVGNNQLEELVVENCPNLIWLNYAHNKIKKEPQIINCPKLKKENIYKENCGNWEAPKTPKEKYKRRNFSPDKAANKKENQIQEAITIVKDYWKSKDLANITLEEVLGSDWANGFANKETILEISIYMDLLKKEIDYWVKLSKNQEEQDQNKENIPPQEEKKRKAPSPEEDFLKRRKIEQLQQKISQLEAGNQTQLEQLRQEILTSELSEEQKQELSRQLEGLTKKTTNNEVVSPSSTPLHYYWGWAFVIVGWIVLASLFILSLRMEKIKKIKFANTKT